MFVRKSNWTVLSVIYACTVLVSLCFAFLDSSVSAADAKGISFFEQHIRPLLIDQCLECHTSEKLKGGLRLDTLQGMLEGGDSGRAAITPGDPKTSLMIRAVQYSNAELQMPPKNKLGKRTIEHLREWIAMGAPWPGESSHSIDTTARSQDGEEANKEGHAPEIKQDYWAFQPLPDQHFASLDEVIESRLSEKQLTPNPEASRRTLIRRAYFGLIGLPPKHAEVESFEADQRPDAFEQRVDHLLSMPGYGERWGRHWLDVVRFAQSNGYERDDEKQEAWRYRDYVIKSFNEDKPYDQFMQEQLAGDEMPHAGDEGIVATGFYRLGVYDDEPDDKRAAEFDGLDDMLRTSSETFLGVTAGCARCHDHMFDPIPQKEYYEMLSFFRSAKPYPDGFLEIADGKAMAITEHGPDPLDTFIMVRGNAGRPSTKVEPRFPTFLGGGKPSPVPTEQSTGLRRSFAKWISSDASSLAARVMANRVWHYHFGKGIVTTPNDFGRAGEPPSDIRLLNWLARELIQGGWSIKHLHRVIMQSKAWKRSSTSNPANETTDPDNRFLWRQNLRRLEAETIRDAMLKVAGNLNRGGRGGRGFFPALNGEVVAGGSRPGRGWGWSSEQEQNQRSIYAFVKRTMVYPFFEIFDYTNTESPLGVRPTTTVAPQALLLLNGEFVNHCAERIAAECLKKENPVQSAFLKTLSRLPDADETRMAETYLEKQTTRYLTRSGYIQFTPDYSPALFDGYQAAVPARRFLKGPDGNRWNYFKGKWDGKYEGIINNRPDAPPFALARERAVDWAIRGRFESGKNNTGVALLLRGTAVGNVYEGYACHIDPVRGSASILIHRKDQDVTEIAKAPVDLPEQAHVDFSASIRGDVISIKVNESSLEVRNNIFADSGHFGVTASGGSVTFPELVVEGDGRRIDLNKPNGQTQLNKRSKQLVFRDFCNLLLNLNEFVYVD